MKTLPWIIALMVSIVIFGCGGSGGGGTTSATATTATTAGTTGDTIVTQLIAESSPGVQVDPTNMQVGDHVTFKLATIDVTTHKYTTVNAGTLSTTDSRNTAGTLNTLTGAYTATASSGGKTFLISTVGSSPSYSTSYAVTPVQARVTGIVVDSNQVPVPFVVVIFKDASGNQLGFTSATVGGTFNGSVPTNAARFNLSSASYSSTAYFSVFTYGAGTYGPLVPTCNAPLPTGLANGVTTQLSGPIILAASSGVGGVGNEPPAPPTCSP